MNADENAPPPVAHNPPSPLSGDPVSQEAGRCSPSEGAKSLTSHETEFSHDDTEEDAKRGRSTRRTGGVKTPYP